MINDEHSHFNAVLFIKKPPKMLYKHSMFRNVVLVCLTHHPPFYSEVEFAELN